MNLKITVPEQYMGDIMGDINSRRGRIMGMNPDANHRQVVDAQAPMSEIQKYAIDLK